MPEIFLGTPRLLSALKRRMGRESDVMAVELPCSLDSDPTFSDFHAAWSCYERITGALEALPATTLRESVATVLLPVVLPLPPGENEGDHAWDALRAYDKDRDPIHRLRLETLLAWLVLTFPEVRWVFWPGCSGAMARNGEVHPLAVWHSLPLGTLSGGKGVGPDGEPRSLSFPALFDPSGLRGVLISLLGTSTGSRLLPPRPSRCEMALAVDEEQEYCFLEAFTAYRFGYRVLAASTWKAFDAIWNWKGTIEHPSLSFEDMYLNFPDQPDRPPDRQEGLTPHLSDLKYRDSRDSRAERGENLFPQVQRRVFVTVGHHKGATGRAIWAENRQYLREAGKKWKYVTKPVGSIFRIAEEARLWDSIRDRARYPPSFAWPPKPNYAEETAPKHSAPGRLLAITERLTRRTRALLKDCDNVQDAVHAAVLALEAKELLADQTPTSALEAIALQHQAEITAESLFIGVEYNLDLHPRFGEIKADVKRVSEWFHGSRKAYSELNARLAIAEQLAQRFSEMNQIEEEASCLEVATRIRFDLWVLAKPWRLPLWPVLRYLSYVLPSLPRLALAVLGWILLFGWIYFLRGTPHPGHFLPYQFLDSVTASAHFFATLQLPDDWSPSLSGAGGQLILVAQGFIALTNLGMLTSNFFSIISRR